MHVYVLYMLYVRITVRFLFAKLIDEFLQQYEAINELHISFIYLIESFSYIQKVYE